ncbi:uncharacterized protein LOC100576058 isoform X2 [Acyrthosiphon pisum]|uniref:KIF-binding protein n=1 Tax=Acyrthosiphon pisum TaxID=7029 RepID=A0A8R2JLV1_ACYPI|nr:uncharacterized protein LOC100576058 isoform X2 [Acyrthosiphon pisum]
MYISLGLLWLCFKIIQGKITQCPLGGIRDRDLCLKLKEDTVFHRFYLNNEYDVNDKDYAVDSELNVLDPLDVMRPSKAHRDTFCRQGEMISMDEYKQKYTKIIFRQPLVVDCNPRLQNNFENIKKLWDKTLSIGTDTYRLKFHDKLLSTYQHKQETLSQEDCMVFIESYYNAASIYFFSRIYITALNIIEDGIKFCLYVSNQQFKDDTSKDSRKVLNSWLCLCESLKQDILIYISPEMRPEHISDVSTTDCTSMQPFWYGVSVLFYRKYFLDNDLEECKKKSLEILATENYKSIEDNDIIYTKYNLMYNYLLLASFGKNQTTKLDNVIYAIRSPVLSIENLSTKDGIINERILHVIVTSAIDIAELDPRKYTTHIKTIETAIKVLKYFVKVLNKEKEKSENNKTEKENKSESEEIDTENYTEKMVDSLSNLTYSMPDKKAMNVFIAYKWLAELYGVLCDTSNHSRKYQEILKEYIGLADEFSKNIGGNDDHLKYLKNKQDAKILLANNSWEVNSWPGGWNFSNLKTETSKTLDTYMNEKKSNMLKDLNSLRNKSNCPYINKIEINILLYRLYVMDSDKNKYKELYQYLAKAIYEEVITSEDRARNMEAHELLSMYLMIQNRHLIEETKTESIYEWITQYMFG